MVQTTGKLVQSVESLKKKKKSRVTALILELSHRCTILCLPDAELKAYTFTEVSIVCSLHINFICSPQCSAPYSTEPTCPSWSLHLHTYNLC